MPRPRDTITYAETQQRIKATAWALMAEVGAAGLSLREIARRMGVSAPALYNYYANQDALMTALIVEAFDGLAEALQTAYQAQAEAPHRQRLSAVLVAYRDWALTHPIKYYLIYGTPVPGYNAPSDVTVPAAVRTFELFGRVIHDALAAGAARPCPPYDQTPPAQQPILEALIAQAGYPVTPLAIYLAFECWGECYKLVMPALLGHYVPLDTDALFAEGIARLCLRVGFPSA